jgi:DNA-binding XRE family transcriptional regulator
LLPIGEQDNLVSQEKQIYCLGLKNMAITPAQCQAARALLSWSQQDLAEHAGVELRTIHYFEKGRTPLRMTLNAITKALEDAGVLFLEDTAEFTNAVAVKPSVDVSRKFVAKGTAEPDDGTPPAGSNAAWDDETRESAIAYWQVEGRWDSLSEPSRALISNQLFGRPDAGDEVFGAQ